MTGLICATVVLGLGLVVTGLGAMAALYLIFKMKAQLDQTGKEWVEKKTQWETAIGEYKAQLQQTTEQIAELQAHAGLMVPAGPAASGLNVNKRSQAMRLLRTGTDADAVAADLQLPKGEVRLLRKVQQLLVTAAK